MPLQELLPSRTLFDPFTMLRRDIDSLFNDFSRTGAWPTAALSEAGTAWFPTINVSDNVESLRITADLPGMERKDVTVAVEEDRLVLSGSRAEEKEEKGRNWYRRERSCGEFRREIPLPCAVDPNKASAAMHNGVLTVELPKRAEAQQKRRLLEIKQS